MTPLAYLTMWGFIPMAIRLFQRYKPAVAAAATFVIGWSFLPQAKFDLPMIPSYTKVSALALAVLISVLIFDRGIFKTLRFSPLDLPMLVWVICPFFTSVSNDLGAYDGIAVVITQIFLYGMPYLVGRLYFGGFEEMRTLAIAMFLGALALAPLAIYEMVMSPVLHIQLYGWYPHSDFSQTKRGGGYRPSVFMTHGLEFAIWMMAGTLLGWILFLSKSLRGKMPLLKLPFLPALGFLTLVTVSLRSSGAVMMLLFGLATFLGAQLFRSKLVLIVLLGLPPLYMHLRASGAWDGQNLIEAAEKATGSKDRADSLAFRLMNETMLVEKAKQRPLLGWGGYQRSYVTNDKGEYISVPDGMWILTFGKFGLLGLFSLSLAYIVPALLFALRYPARVWGEREWAPVTGFAILMGLTMIDNLFNAMYNPVTTLAMGGLVSFLARPKLAGEQAEVPKVTEVEPMASLPRVI